MNLDDTDEHDADFIPVPADFMRPKQESELISG